MDDYKPVGLGSESLANSPDQPLEDTNARDFGPQSAESKAIPAVSSLTSPPEPAEDIFVLDQELEPEFEPYVPVIDSSDPCVKIAVGPKRAFPGNSLRIVGRPVAQLAPIELETVAEPATIDLETQLLGAREFAEFASHCQERTNHALYRAIGSAYDLALTAANSPVEFDAILRRAGLEVQRRAPMTPVVKLVFGVQYNKTRLAEYAAALDHACRLGIGYDSFGQYLLETPGGLKAVVDAERRLRREESGRAALVRPGSLEALAGELRALPTQLLSEIESGGDEFVLILARRMPGGELAPVGKVPRIVSLLEKAAGALIGKSS